MHHSDYAAHHAMRVTRNPNDAYCVAAKRTLKELAVKRTIRQRMVAVMALVDAVCIAIAIINI